MSEPSALVTSIKCPNVLVTRIVCEDGCEIAVTESSDPRDAPLTIQTDSVNEPYPGHHIAITQDQADSLILTLRAALKEMRAR